MRPMTDQGGARSRARRYASPVFTRRPGPHAGPTRMPGAPLPHLHARAPAPQPRPSPAHPVDGRRLCPPATGYRS